MSRRRGGQQKPIAFAPGDIEVLGGDIIGSDAEKDTKVTLESSRARVIVDNEVRIDAQSGSVSLSVGVGQGLEIDAQGATIMARPVRTITANGSALSSDGVIVCDTSSNSIALTLPSPATVPAGREYVIKDIGNASVNPITISCSGFNVGGGSSHIISAQRGQVTALAYSTEWLVF